MGKPVEFSQEEIDNYNDQRLFISMRELRELKKKGIFEDETRD